MNNRRPFIHPSGIRFTKEQLAPHFLDVVQTVKAELPDLLSGRLTHGRHIRNHGNYNDFFLINLWDKRQSAVLPKDHFTYCLSYCPQRSGEHPQDGELHLWLNKIRIYQNRTEIIEILDRQLKSKVPPGFTFESAERFISISHRFYLPADMDLFAGYLVPLYKQLVLNVHPVLMEVIDEFTGPMEKEELRRVVRERDRLPFEPPARRKTEALRAYSRSIAPSLRVRILKRHGHQCAECGRDLRASGHHIDHIIPFSKGGLTVEENLQALCPGCNLAKGNR